MTGKIYSNMTKTRYVMLEILAIGPITVAALCTLLLLDINFKNDFDLAQFSVTEGNSVTIYFFSIEYTAGLVYYYHSTT